MKPIILVVEDNQGMLFNIKMTLEFNNYEVITATNGKEGVKLLSKMEHTPNLIISDIMMPEMDGYEFFDVVSDNPDWSLIPFLFLTAKAAPEDVRFGRILGVDDYITKPFEEEDLLSIIKGKIVRSKKSELIRKQIEEKLLSSLKIDISPSISEEEKQSVSVLYLVWDELRGPILVDSFPKDQQYGFNLTKDIGIQLFHASVSIFGQHAPLGSAGILLKVKNVGKDGYVFFDIKKDEEVRGGERLFMLAVLAPKINYYDSLKINELFQEITKRIKKSNEWSVQEKCEEISKILTSS